MGLQPGMGGRGRGGRTGRAKGGWEGAGEGMEIGAEHPSVGGPGSGLLLVR